MQGVFIEMFLFWLLIALCLNLHVWDAYSAVEFQKWQRKCANRGQIYCIPSNRCVDFSYDCYLIRPNMTKDNDTRQYHRPRGCLQLRFRKTCDMDLICYDDQDICDGIHDCADGTDEKGCPHCGNMGDTVKTNCTNCFGLYPYLCDPDRGRYSCFGRSQVCNGHADCIDGSDERGCLKLDTDEKTDNDNNTYSGKQTKITVVIIVVAVVLATIFLCIFVLKRQGANLLFDESRAAASRIAEGEAMSPTVTHPDTTNWLMPPDGTHTSTHSLDRPRGRTSDAQVDHTNPTNLQNYSSDSHLPSSPQSVTEDIRPRTGTERRQAGNVHYTRTSPISNAVRSHVDPEQFHAIHSHIANLLIPPDSAHTSTRSLNRLSARNLRVNSSHGTNLRNYSSESHLASSQAFIAEDMRPRTGTGTQLRRHVDPSLPPSYEAVISMDRHERNSPRVHHTGHHASSPSAPPVPAAERPPAQQRDTLPPPPSYNSVMGSNFV